MMKYQVLFPEGKKKAVTFSYDDGQYFDRRLVEMFNKYNVKATFHLVTGWLKTEENGEPFLDKSEVTELFKGHEISCHGYDHPYFVQIPHDQMVKQIYEDKRSLEELAGYPVRGMSYPYGEFPDGLIDTASKLGMEYGRTVEDTMGFNLPGDFMRWNPSCHHNKFFDICDEFLTHPPYRELMLFYIWGHSFEFDRENNWDHMEKVLATISGKDDTWYATNIEIKDYMDAAHSLKVTVNEDIVYNPTATPVYILNAGEIVIAKPGEYLKLK